MKDVFTIDASDIMKPLEPWQAQVMKVVAERAAAGEVVTIGCGRVKRSRAKATSRNLT